MRVCYKRNRDVCWRVRTGASSHASLSGAPATRSAATARAPRAKASRNASGQGERGKKGKPLVGSMPSPLNCNRSKVHEAGAVLCGQSVQAALQAAYPPVPLVTGFGDDRRCNLSPRSFPGRDFLPLPTTDCAAGRSVTEGERETVSSGSGRAALQQLLRDLATLPLDAGACLTRSLKDAASQDHHQVDWQALVEPKDVEREEGEQRAAGRASGPTVVAATGPSLTRMDAAGEHPGGVVCDMNLPDSPDNPDGRAVGEAWQPFTEYDDVQPCTETPAFALRSFCTETLAQRVPVVALIAERGYNSKLRCVSQRLHRPGWLPLNTAVYSMPVEVYAERTPLRHTEGTVSLQQRLALALQEVPSLPAAHDKHNTAPLSSLVHLVWNGRCWVEETDAQVAQMEERILSEICGTDRAQSAVGSRDNPGWSKTLGIDSKVRSSSLPRFWLPSSWRNDCRASRTFTLAVGHHDRHSNNGSLSGCSGRAGAAETPTYGVSKNAHEAAKPASENTRAARGFVAAEVAAPSNLTGKTPSRPEVPCCQWLLRIRKTWLLTGPHIKSSMFSRVGARAYSRTNAPRLHPVSSVRYPNYDILTGVPLDLSFYNDALAGNRKTAKVLHAYSSSPQSPLVASPRSPSGTTQSPLAHGCDTPSTNSAQSLSERDPFLCAAISQQVGWVRLTLTSRGHESHVVSSAPSSPTAPPSMPPVSWQLPEPLRSCYTIPKSIEDAPYRYLCGPLRVAAPSTTSAPSSTTAQPPLWSPPPPPDASVSVPLREWWTGFFLHDAPFWWRRDMHRSFPRNQAEMTTCQGTPDTFVLPGHWRDGKPRTAAEEVEQVLWFLQKECRVPPPPVKTTVVATVGMPHPCQGSPKQMTVTSMPCEVTQKLAVMPPQVCVLRVAPVAPALRRARRSVRRDEPGMYGHQSAPLVTPESRELELQWVLVPDTATATVNTFFSLQDALNCRVTRGTAAVDQSPASPPNRPLFYFVEVKAALEVLRRVGRAGAGCEDFIGDAEDPWRGPSPSGWWEPLGALYNSNTFFVNEPTGPGATLAADVCTEEGNSDNDVCAPEGAAPAFCHPAVSEVVRTCVQLMLQCGKAPHRCIQGDSFASLESRGPGNKNVSSESVTVWSRAEYNALLGHVMERAHEDSPMPPRPRTSLNEIANSDLNTSGEAALTSTDAAVEMTRKYECDDTAEMKTNNRGSHAVSTAMLMPECTNTATRAATRSSPEGAKRFRRKSSSRAGQSEKKSLTRRLCGVGNHAYDKSGTRLKGSDGSDGCATSSKKALLLSDVLRDRLLGAVTPAGCPSPTSTHGTSSHASLPTAASSSVFELTEKSVQAMPLSALWASSPITPLHREATQPNRAPKQRPIKKTFISSSHHEDSSCAGYSKDHQGLVSSIPSVQDKEMRTESPPLDVMATLSAEEHKAYEMRWRSWLKYLPLPERQNEDSSLPTAAQITEPRTHVTAIFPFLKSSAASDYYTAPPTTGLMDAENHAPRRRVKDSVLPLAPAATEGTVVVPDLGLCVLCVCWTSVYVNSANLMYRGET